MAFKTHCKINKETVPSSMGAKLVKSPRHLVF
jgi:hypothetical protein